MADQNPLQPSTADQYGPFTENLTGPLTPKQQPASVQYAPSKAGALALFATNFLQGLQAGRRTKYERSERDKSEQYQAFASQYAKILQGDYLPEIKAKATKLYNDSIGPEIVDATKAAKKDNPIIHLAHQIGSAMAGPGENKKHKNFAQPLAQMQNLGNPSNKIDPNFGTIGSVTDQAAQIAAPPQQAPQQQQQTKPPTFNLPGAPTAPPLQGTTQAAPQAAPAQQSAAPAAPTPPPPGTTPAATQGGLPWKTQEEALASKQYTDFLDQTQKYGKQPTDFSLGRAVAALPKAGVPKKVGQGTRPGPDGKPIAYEVFQGTDGKLEPIDIGPAYEKPTKLSTVTEKRQQLKDDYKLLGMSDEEADKKVAELDTKAVENKIKPKPTPEDQLATYLVDSGTSNNPEDAKKTAATMLVNLQKAKIKAAERGPAGGGAVSFTGPELDALASWSIATGQQPAFGLGANNPNRTAYQKALANKLTGGSGIGGALETKTDFKALNSELTNLNKLQGTVGSFEKSANAALDNALKASKDYPRDSSALVNGWDQWVTKHAVDDPKLQQLMVYTETAANEYARVIGSITGASTNAARDQANSFIRAQLAEQSFEGAAQAMKTDMANRTGSISDTINGVRGQIANIGKPQSTGNNPPPANQAVDPSKKSIKVGDKTVNIGDLYKGSKIIGFTSDGHLVTE